MPPSPHCPPTVDPTPPEPAETMTVRIANRGYSRSYEGVRVVTVTIAKTCPKCGGPRGEAYHSRVIEDGEHYAVDQWDNGCGHVDYYSEVLIEAGIHPPHSERAQ